MAFKEKIVVSLERLILALCGLAIFLRLLSFRFLISYKSPESDIERVLLASLPSQFVALFIYIIFFLFLIKLIIQRRSPNLNIPMSIFFSGLIVLCSLSLIYSVNRDSTLIFIWNFLPYFYLFSILYDCLNTHWRIMVFIFLLLAAGLATTLAGLYHYFLIYGYVLSNLNIQPYDYRIRNIFKLKRIAVFFGWPNQLAGFLSMMLPLNIVCAKLTQNKREKIYMAIACIIVFLATIFTYSIGGLLSLFIAAIVTVSLYSRKITLKSIKAKVVLAGVILLLFLSISAVVNKRADKITAGSFAARGIYFKSAVSMIKDNPIFGTGAGTFKDVFPAHITRAIEYTAHAHNCFLEFWTDLGIAGFLLFSFFLTYILYIIGSRLRKEQEPQKKLLLAGLFCSITAFSIHNLVDFTIFVPAVSFYWWIIISLGFVLISPGPSPEKRDFIIKRLFIPCGILSVIVAFAFLCRQFAADIYFFKAEGLRNNRGRIEETIDFLEISKKLNPFDGRYAKALGDLYFREFIRSGKAIYLDKAIEQYRHFVKLNTTDGSGYYNLAVGYNIKGEHELANQFYKKALLYRPYIGDVLQGATPQHKKVTK
ncbi:MAG: O-antigen ligase family protein [Candidatus Omnitrophota bacterium]|nr:MAG: O-antigen ligase family protein [Candidatus Omnitrophota bacterium]